MTGEFSALIEATGAVAISTRAEDRSIVERVRSEPRSGEADTALQLVRAAQLLEGEALHSRNDDEKERLWEAAFSCWRDVVMIGSFDPEELDGKLLRPSVSLAFHIAVTGTLARRTSEVRQALSQYLPEAAIVAAQTTAPVAWSLTALNATAKAIVLLTRKQGGWDDIAVALGLLDSLRELQTQQEEPFLEESNDGYAAAVELVAIYHLAQMATITGRYIELGEGAARGIAVRLDTHLNQAEQAIALLSDGRLSRLAGLLHALLRSLLDHSIWNQVEGMGSEVGELVNAIASRDKDLPFLELWPSQEGAMKKNFLDTYRRAVIVEMPTSAGKTLLAEFSIVQTHALNRSATIAYVVPTRALVNQVTDQLRGDLRPLGMTVEQAVPVFELDPTENVMLSTPPAVLVTTPEKLDLLIRTDHESLKNLSLVVVDEAHNLSDGTRGARLELVLATIRRDRPGARYLLLSPFVPNAQELVTWLGDDRGLDPIHVHWQPNKRVVGALEVTGSRKTTRIVLKTITAIDNSDLPAGREIALGGLSRKPSGLKGISIAAAGMLSDRGQTLIVCTGKSYAVVRALEIAGTRPERQLSEFGEAVIRHTIAELGPGNALAKTLRRGVAYHHSGVSIETRRFIEALMRGREIDTICGTTTLAQGVNFPLANVIIEGRQKGRHATLSYSDFWNIAGRAGRGLTSDLGVIAFPVSTDDQRSGWERFFEGEAANIASQLASVVTSADTIGKDFTLGALRTTPGLSAFLQYLAHAMKVSGSMDAANQVEDLLRSSLIFRQVEQRSPADAIRLVNLCRAYLDNIRGRSSVVSIADGTGFSTPTIGSLLAQTRNMPDLGNRATWEPAALFGNDITGLAERIRLIGDLPEMELSDGENGPFNPERIARMLRDWVNGASVSAMSETFGNSEKTEIQRNAAFSGYLNSKLTQLASWGLGALESVALAGTEPDASSDSGHVPSMVYFGVRDKESVWLRMAGLTREAAPGAAELWREQGNVEPTAFAELRDWITQVDASQWDRALNNSPLSGSDMVLLWNELHK